MQLQGIRQALTRTPIHGIPEHSDWYLPVKIAILVRVRSAPIAGILHAMMVATGQTKERT